MPGLPPGLQREDRGDAEILPGDLEDQNLFGARAISAIQGCLPLDVTPGPGGAIANRQIFFGVISGKWGP